LVLHLSLSVYYYRPKPKIKDKQIIEALDRLAELFPTYGFKKMYHLLRSEGHKWNHKRVYRIYVMMGLNMRRRRKRRLPARVKTPHIIPIEGNVTWSVDFMQDSLVSGQKFRAFNVIDDHNREALMINVDTSLSSRRITRELDRLIEWRGKPEMIRADNGPEFTSAAFEAWARKNRITICFIQPGKPTQNSLIERFNGNYRREVLNAHLFQDLKQVREETQKWMWIYNNIRPHEALDNKPPAKWMQYRSQIELPSFFPGTDLMKETKFITASI
jgi:putative transposase